MPCYDSDIDDEERLRDSQHRHALTALLCGYMQHREIPTRLAIRWLHRNSRKAKGRKR